MKLVRMVNRMTWRGLGLWLMVLMAGCGEEKPMAMKSAGGELEQALDRMIELARTHDANDLPFDIGGHDQAEIDAHSAKLGQSIPPEVAALYRRVKGQEHSMQGVWVLPLSETQWAEADEVIEIHGVKEDYPEWHAAHYFIFGRGCFGDALAYCPDPPGRESGAVLMLNHEQRWAEDSPSQPCTVVFHGDSLAQWIERWARHEFVDYDYVPGGIDEGLSPEEAEACRRESERLNPGCE